MLFSLYLFILSCSSHWFYIEVLFTLVFILMSRHAMRSELGGALIVDIAKESHECIVYLVRQITGLQASSFFQKSQTGTLL